MSALPERQCPERDTLLAMPATDCPICRGSGWVCEDHPGEPWEHAGCGGAGVACQCNPGGLVQWQQVIVTTDPERDTPLQ
jgi:hypothetical protein